MTEIHENDAAAVALIAGAVSQGVQQAEAARLQREDPLNHPTHKAYNCRSCGLIDVLPIDVEPTACRCGASIDHLGGAEELVRERDRIEHDSRRSLNTMLLEESNEGGLGNKSIEGFMRASGGVNRDGSTALPVPASGLQPGSHEWKRAMFDNTHPGHDAVVLEFQRNSAIARSKGENYNASIPLDTTPKNMMSVESPEFLQAFKNPGHPKHAAAQVAAQHYATEAHEAMAAHEASEDRRMHPPIQSPTITQGTI